jgi:hypothetical protein
MYESVQMSAQDRKDAFDALVKRVQALEEQLDEHKKRPHLQTRAEQHASLLAEAEEMVAEIPADSWLWIERDGRRQLYLNAGVTGDHEHDHASYLRGIWNQAHKDDEPKTCQDSDHRK